ncbi:MAG: hypothetical protein ACRDM1_03085 [Gaiellaceae bacterium]
MRETKRSRLPAAAMIVALVLAGCAVVAAPPGGGSDGLATLAWLPAVLIAAFAKPGRNGRCSSLPLVSRRRPPEE